ncbi:MAG: DUF3095 family protein [Pseudomonadota bacterium]
MIMGQPEADERFYENLPPFMEFDRFTEFDAYAPVPDDWVVLAGDIEGSTQAIAEGRYKAVNMVGAAVITAVLNSCKDVQVPFVFGGDGGVVVVPQRFAEAGSAALSGLQAHSRSTFGLDLRAAAVSVARLRREGSDLKVRRFALNGSNHLAMFSGGGIDHVDTILKASTTSDPDVLVHDSSASPPDLEGLSCRWEPLTAEHGRMIALMVLPVGSEAQDVVYRDVVRHLSMVLDENIPAHAPAKDPSLRLRFPPSYARMEVAVLALKLGRLKAWGWFLLTAVLQQVSHLRGVRIGTYEAPVYLEELKQQTDFRKYDGCLRTVLDCSPEQVAEIERWLSQQHQNGRLVFGLHADREALMTCLLFSLEQGEHVHFVDAAGGGFASASVGFKRRLDEISKR